MPTDMGDNMDDDDASNISTCGTTKTETSAWVSNDLESVSSSVLLCLLIC